MAGEQSGPGSERGTGERGAHDELLLRAVSILRMRQEKGGRYDLSESAAANLGDTLSEIAAAHDVEGVDRQEAIALAHRLLDDDHPEQSPMWPGRTG